MTNRFSILEEKDDDEGIFITERDESIMTFKKHTNSLFCESFSPCENFDITGAVNLQLL